MAVQINGDTGIDKVQAGAVETGDLPAGTVLQVVSANATSETANTSTSWTSTGFSITITPKSSTSHFLVRFDVNAYMGYGEQGGVDVYRGGSSVSGGLTYGMGFLWQTTERGTHPISRTFLDTTTSASAITYTLYTKTTGGTINCPHAPSTDMINSMTVMEIAQ